jgi:hypothetical protein
VFLLYDFAKLKRRTLSRAHALLAEEPVRRAGKVLREI